MSLKAVNLESDVYLVCLTHALSTEREEVMGLLMGEVDEQQVLHISAVTILRRSDKQPDRVEISPEQQTAASIKAEQLSKDLKRPMRVVGWYHSHPHITVWPSHVDVRTQANYQQMDSGFVGLIFSVFNEDKTTKHNKIQVTCFQSREGHSWNSTEFLKNMFQRNMQTEKIRLGQKIKVMCDHCAHKVAKFSSRFFIQDLSESVLTLSSYERVEIPLYIIPSYSISPACLSPLVELPTILLQEEEEAYASVSDGKRQDLLTRIHNASVYTKSVCHVMEMISGPLVHNLECRLENNQRKIKQLKEEKAILLEKLSSYERTKMLPV